MATDGTTLQDALFFDSDQMKMVSYTLSARDIILFRLLEKIGARS